MLHVYLVAKSLILVVPDNDEDVNVDERHEKERRKEERRKDSSESSFFQKLPLMTTLRPEPNPIPS